MQWVAMAFIRCDLPAGSPFLPSFSPPDLVPRWVVSTAVSPDEGARARVLRDRERDTWQERERKRQRTPGTTLAAVCIDIQVWLIYGAGESVSLLWVLDRTGQTGLLAALSPPTLLVTSFYHCTVTDGPSTARLYTVECQFWYSAQWGGQTWGDKLIFSHNNFTKWNIYKCSPSLSLKPAEVLPLVSTWSLSLSLLLSYLFEASIGNALLSIKVRSLNGHYLTWTNHEHH